MNTRRPLMWTIAAIGAVMVIGELGVRLIGLLDFPIYSVDAGIGYIPRPDQHGCFLNKNCWDFNDRSMGVANPWNPASRPNVLLIGNSIVMGGNPYDQHEKLGPLIQQSLGPRCAVWPIAAGGWTNVNETVYLQRHPEVVRGASFFVWEYMAGGLSGLADWKGEYLWPDHRPLWGFGYATRRYLLPRIFKSQISELPPRGALDERREADFESMLGALTEAIGRPGSGMLFLYPDRAQLLAARSGQDWLPERSVILQLAQKYGLRVIDVATYPQWNIADYREDATHPTVQGNHVLAGILSDAIRQNIPSPPRAP